jgi:hypothetical protein
MVHYKTEELTVLETRLQKFTVNVELDMEAQFAKFDNLAGKIAMHCDGTGPLADKALVIKMIPNNKPHTYTDKLRTQRNLVLDAARTVPPTPILYADFKEKIMRAWRLTVKPVLEANKEKHKMSNAAKIMHKR